MSKDVYIYSTMTSGVTYAKWENKGGVPTIVGHVVINGGANLANKQLVTPQGVVTKISEEDLAFLEKNHVWKIHKDSGHVFVSTSKTDPNKVAADMEGRDGSAPLVPQDYELGKQASDAKPADLQTDVKPGKKASAGKR